jgi:hypothetical protein
VKALILGLLLAASALGCSGARKLPSGPAPEYERPVLPPWDSGRASDPLDEVEGEEVTEEPEGPADGGVAPLDSGV